MKFYQIRSRGCGEMASDGRTDGLTDKRTDRRSDGQTKQQLYASPLGSIKSPCFYVFLFLHVCSTSLLKTQWETEKLLITSNFSISYSAFNPLGELSAIFMMI